MISANFVSSRPICSTVITSGPRRAYFSGKPRSRAQAAARQYCSFFAALRMFLTRPSSALPFASRSFFGELRIALGRALDRAGRAADVLGGHVLAASHAEDGHDLALLLLVEHRRRPRFATRSLLSSDHGCQWSWQWSVGIGSHVHGDANRSNLLQSLIPNP